MLTEGQVWVEFNQRLSTLRTVEGMWSVHKERLSKVVAKDFLDQHVSEHDFCTL